MPTGTAKLFIRQKDARFVREHGGKDAFVHILTVHILTIQTAGLGPDREAEK
jgi:cold shock CspA family protein